MTVQPNKRRDHDGPTATPEWAEQLIHAVRGLQKDMVRLMSDQSKLDADVQAENDALTVIEKEIADLKNQPPAAALDFTALDAAVARIKGDEPAPTPPTPPAPGPAGHRK